MQQQASLKQQRLHPIELQLDLEQGLRVKKNDGSTEEIKPKDINNMDIHQGLLSEQLYISKSENDKIKLMICVTMYNESLEEMTKSTESITGSLNNFLNFIDFQNFSGFLPHQIAVFVMFDGIENVNNGKPNPSDDVISYFSGHCDENYEIKKEMTLKRQFKLYTSSKKNLKEFSQDKRDYYSAQRKLAQEAFEKYDRTLRPYALQVLEEDKKIDTKINQSQNQQNNGSQNNDPQNKDSLPKLNVGQIIQCMKLAYDKSNDYINSKKNSALVYQDQIDFRYRNSDKITDYLPIYYVFKYENGSKLSSHMWFFKGFCSLLNPEYCLLMDAGAIAKPESICNLFFAMVQDPKIGGVCGTMRIDLSTKNSKGDIVYKDIFTKYLSRIFSIKRCQSCEYDIGHIFDKSFEASMNYIHVLPGAFSGYRYQAFFKKYGQINKPQDSKNILNIYLKQVLDQYHQHDTLQEANMFLAEDRVLCSLLFCNGYHLRYVKDAFVKVDPLKSVFKLLNQRRRWINGSWFALNYVVENFQLHMKNNNQISTKDKWLFFLNLTFAKMSQVQQYFLLSFQTVWNYMILDVIFSPQNRIIIFRADDEIYNSIMKQLFIAIYIFMVLMLVFLSLSYNPAIFDSIPDEKKRDQQKRNAEIFFVSKFYGVSTLLGLMSLFTVGFTIYLFYSEIIKQGKLFDFYDYPYIPQNYLFLFVIISIAFQALPYFFWIFLEFRMVMSVLCSLIHYFYYMPTYTHLFQVFAFCRIDDLSWGTKGLSTNKTFNSETEQTYEKFTFLCKWIVLNSLVTTIIFILFYLQINLIFAIIILSFTVIFTLVTIFKSVGAIIYCICYRSYIKKIPCSTEEEIKKSIEEAKNHMALIEKLYPQ